MLLVQNDVSLRLMNRSLRSLDENDIEKIYIFSITFINFIILNIYNILDAFVDGN